MSAIELAPVAGTDSWTARDLEGSGVAWVIDRASTLYPRCHCPAGANGRDCKHVNALMEERMGSLRDKLEMDTKAVVPVRASQAQLAEVKRQALASVASGYQDALVLGQAMVAAKIAPDGVNEQQAAIIAMQAVDLGIPPMQAFSYIAVIKGKPFLMSRMVGALVERSGKGHIEDVDVSPTAATVRAIRQGRAPLTVTITMQQAQAAGWANNTMYKSHPANMLRARAVTTAGWRVFPDVLSGMDIAEEGSDLYIVDPEAVPASAVAVEHPAPVAKAEPSRPALAIPGWIAELKEQVAAWGLKMSDLHDLLGATVSVKSLVNWAASLDADPFDAALAWLRENKLSQPSVVEGESWEIPADQIVPDDDESPLA